MKLFKAKELVMIAAMVLVFMSIAIFYYSRSPGGLIDIVDGNPVKAIFYRFYALQGYAWPRFYELYTNNGLMDTSYATYMDAARYELLADPGFYEANSINLANVYPGIILYQYGFFTVILLNIALSAIIAVLSVIAYYLISTGSILRSTLVIQLLFWSVATIPNANFEVFVSLKFLVFLVVLVFLTLVINFYDLAQRKPKEGKVDEC